MSGRLQDAELLKDGLEQRHLLVPDCLSVVALQLVEVAVGHAPRAFPVKPWMPRKTLSLTTHPLAFMTSMPPM